MSTRSIIGTGTAEKFEGRYCHRDGSPPTRGRELVETYRQLGGDPAAVITYAIRPDAGPEGYWSSFMPPARVAANEVLPERVPCTYCAGTGTRSDDVGVSCGYQARGYCNGCSGTGRMPNLERHDGFRTDNGDGWAVVPGDDWDAKWAYLLGDDGIAVLAPTADGWEELGAVAWESDPSAWQIIRDAA